MKGDARKHLHLGILFLVVGLSLQTPSSPSQGKNVTRRVKDSHHLKRRAQIRQKRAWIIDAFEIQEELPGPYPKFIGTVNLENNQLRYRLKGKGVDEDPKGLFSINEENGNIYVHDKVDFEVTPMFNWEFLAINKTSNKLGTKLGIQMKVLDINDNAPEFTSKSYDVAVNESCTQGSTVFTLLAYDKDSQSSSNSLVYYHIVSQSPTDTDTEFTIDKENGFIFFKGCLDYERNKNYKLVFEAKDNGATVQQSSQCEVLIHVIDRNNHPPMWTSEAIQAEVPEREDNRTVTRLGVTDGDSPYTPAWRAVYTILSGNDDGNFIIETDPQTNEGILTVIKPLDYERNQKNELSIVVANQEPLFSCKIMERPPAGLWVVNMEKNIKPKKFRAPKSLTVKVKDVNDPPEFVTEKIGFSIVEHSLKPGTPVGTIQAKDMDIITPNIIKYKILNDPANWVSIDENTGIVTCTGEMDRESQFVSNSKYNVTILAVDDGVPSMTGTATLIFTLKDINDNTPQLDSPYLTTCDSEEEALLSTHIIDKDLDPYSGPFYIDVTEEDPKKHLKLVENNGNVLIVLKQKDATIGNHTLRLEIYDRQGVISQQNFTVNVCECLEGGACIEKMSGPPTLGGGSIALLLLVPVLFLFLSLLVCKIQRVKEMIPVEQEPLNTMIMYNEEAQNQDCQESKGEEIDLAFHRASTRKYSAPTVTTRNVMVGQSSALQTFEQSMKQTLVTTSSRAISRRHSSYHRERKSNGYFMKSSANTAQQLSSAHGSSSSRSHHSRVLESFLTQKLSSNLDDDLAIYKPRIFTLEGDMSPAPSLDALTISGSSTVLDKLDNFGSKFNILESLILEHKLGQSKDEPSTYDA